MQLYQYKIANLIHVMIEVELWSNFVTKNQRFLKEKKIFSLIYIIREVHTILAIVALINNYIDCDQFNILYNENFEIKRMYNTNKVATQFK